MPTWEATPTEIEMRGGGSRQPWYSRFEERLFQPVDGASIAVFRVVFGTIMAAGALRYFVYDWLNLLFLQPDFHFKYWGFYWVEQPSPLVLHLIAGTLFLSSLMLVVGWRSRLAALLTFLSFSYLELIDVTNYLNHHYLAALLAFLLIFLPTSQVYSIDSWRAAQRGTPLPTTVPALGLYLLRLQLVVVYFFAGIAKISGDWLIYAQPLSIWLTPRTDLFLIGPLLGLKWTPLILSWSGCLYDLSIGFFLLSRRTRPYAFFVVLCFHSLTRAFFNIGLFPWIMTGSSLIFFSASWPRNLASFVAARLPKKRTNGALAQIASAQVICSGASTSLSPLLRRAAFGATVLYALLQVLTPLRAFAYPGDVLWGEDGMRFSWRVMIREKSASITYQVKSKVSNRQTLVSPRRYLNMHQTREMGGQPDMIAQLARHIGRDYSQRWGEPVTVHADTWISFNGRKPARFLDETVDLAATVDDLSPTSYILPRPAGPPAQFY